MNKILAAWAWNGPVSEPIAYGEGHINQTYALTEQATQKRYICLLYTSPSPRDCS